MMPYRPCVIVPFYNHHRFIAATLAKLAPYSMDVLLIDDGSDEPYRAEPDCPVRLHVVRLPKNLGKGAAVMAGFQEAFRQGYSHALQIDADGQHDISDVPLFLEESRFLPNAVVSGRPIYDASAPKLRIYGRYATHIWVWIETLSFEIKDSMCGFRLYPLEAAMRLIERVRIGRRMDFDTDILVRLYWQGVPVRFVETRVIYPEDGVSHFQGFSDNWRISMMHTRLFFGMLTRLPALLRRKGGL
jgi:glycosyltransferase involved in cell wall biosynthesis